MSPRLTLRFDVDTHRCVREGMPALVELGARFDAPLTFFVNMGRAISRLGALRALGPSSGGFVGAGAEDRTAGPTAAKLSARVKLGPVGWLEAALLNPPVGAGSLEVLRTAVEAGHEVGLHGGTNHASWQRGAAQWSRERLGEEIDAVLPILKAATGGRRVHGFASPGWTTHPELPGVLAERGFAYVADAHGPARSSECAALGRTPDLPLVRTQLTGEPGGVAYLEHLRALGLGDSAMVARFEADLLAAGERVALYDHPYHAGIRELDVLGRLIQRARVLGYEIVPMAALAGVEDVS